MKTYTARSTDTERRWWVVDAEGQILGRMATRVAALLRGKHRPEFSPHLDLGDYVVVVNAEKIAVTGDRMAQKTYYRHSGYPGGLREETLGDLLERRPETVVRLAVKGMLPHNRLGRQMLRKLKVYAGPDHPHGAQGPVVLDLYAVPNAAQLPIPADEREPDVVEDPVTADVVAEDVEETTE